MATNCKSYKNMKCLPAKLPGVQLSGGKAKRPKSPVKFVLVNSNTHLKFYLKNKIYFNENFYPKSLHLRRERPDC